LKAFFEKYPHLKNELTLSSNDPIAQKSASDNLVHLSIGYKAILDYRIKRMRAGSRIPNFKLSKS